MYTLKNSRVKFTINGEEVNPEDIDNLELVEIDDIDFPNFKIKMPKIILKTSHAKPTKETPVPKPESVQRCEDCKHIEPARGFSSESKGFLEYAACSNPKMYDPVPPHPISQQLEESPCHYCSTMRHEYTYICPGYEPRQRPESSPVEPDTVLHDPPPGHLSSSWWQRNGYFIKGLIIVFFLFVLGIITIIATSEPEEVDKQPIPEVEESTDIKTPQDEWSEESDW